MRTRIHVLTRANVADHRAWCAGPRDCMICHPGQARPGLTCACGGEATAYVHRAWVCDRASCLRNACVRAIERARTADAAPIGAPR